MKLIIALISGLLFGSGMVISQMVDPQKVIAFLNVTGNWDPSLAFVMGGALAVFTPCYHFLIKPRKAALSGDKFSCASNTQIDNPLIIGAAIFGAGWGLAGICPGPAISSIAGGSFTIVYFILSMLIGMLIAKQFTSGKLTLSFQSKAEKARL